MGTVASFQEKHRMKQLNFEQQILKCISLNDVEQSVDRYFDPWLADRNRHVDALNEICLDYAIETYLLGAGFSRFAYFGEPVGAVFTRSRSRFKPLLEDFFDIWIFWNYTGRYMDESIYRACEGFMYYWWKEGFTESLRRFRLKLNK